MTLFPLLAAAAAASASPPALQPTPASAGTANVAAIRLFEQDWILMGWALARYDRDHDGILQPSEASAAAAEFRSIADGDSDGRVTPYEYRQAREFIVARY